MIIINITQYIYHILIINIVLSIIQTWCLTRSTYTQHRKDSTTLNHTTHLTSSANYVHSLWKFPRVFWYVWHSVRELHILCCRDNLSHPQKVQLDSRLEQYCGWSTFRNSMVYFDRQYRKFHFLLSHLGFCRCNCFPQPHWFDVHHCTDKLCHSPALHVVQTNQIHVSWTSRHIHIVQPLVSGMVVSRGVLWLYNGYTNTWCPQNRHHKEYDPV